MSLLKDDFIHVFRAYHNWTESVAITRQYLEETRSVHIHYHWDSAAWQVVSVETKTVLFKHISYARALEWALEITPTGIYHDLAKENNNDHD